MKNRFIIWSALLVIFATPCFSQTLSQDAEGKSTILYQGGNISLDIAKENLTFAYSNHANLSLRPYTLGVPKFAWGVNAYGKNEDSKSLLFERGKFQPNVGFGGFLGLSFKLDDNPSAEELKKVEEEIEAMNKSREIVLEQIKLLEPKRDKRSKTKLAQRKVQLKTLEKAITDKDAIREKLGSKVIRKRSLIYVKGGRSATSFKREESNLSGIPLSKSFINQDFKGGNFGIGINYERGSWLFGLEAENEFTNNFETLTKSTYTLTNTETSGANTLESKKEITAYSGNYQKYRSTNINFDAILFSAIGNNENDYIAWNFYLRHKISNATSIMPTYTNIGAGAYFFNKSNKFLGGIYVEAPDAFEKIESKKVEPNFKKIHDRLTFGVVARFSFSSILGTNN